MHFNVESKFSISSCDKCADTQCFTPPKPFYFQLIDKETDSVEIEGQKQVILLNDEISWQSRNDSKNYLLLVKNSLVYDFVYHNEKKNRDCCAFYEIEEINSSKIEIVKLNSDKGFLYKFVL